MNKANQDRPIRNDLTGALPGMVQFVQSHSINPKGNSENNLPTLVTSRNALLLFTPQRSPVGKVRVEVQLDGATKHTTMMAAPNQLPATDVSGTDGRPDVAYTKRAWSTVLPWSVVKPGMTLVFHDESGQSGTLVASQIEMAAPAKMYIWGIRLGMLTSPPAVDTDGQPMLTKPARAATDYFQMLPVSQLTVASYEDVKLDKVMLGDGTILTGASKSQGGVYDGDMREQVGKSQFSIGINLANYGVSSSINGDQSIGETTPQIVYHHSVGNYANGVQAHGLSGGGAIATLSGSYGNEFSHELGHHYGMGHYPGQVGNDGFWAHHHADSGWGYIDHRKRMRSNLMWSAKERDPGAGTVNPQSFAHQYIYQKDPMSGAWLEPDPMLSMYTYYTGYTATRIQKFMDKAWFDPNSTTGYSHWDSASKKVVAATSADRAPPTRFGVPVFTLLGAYDPSNNTAVMYPPARANYGMVFDKLPAPDAAATAACWIDVRFANGSKSITLQADRIRQGSANKFHVNIAEADRPQSASLSCRKGGQITRMADVSFPQNLPAMQPAVVVGEAAGYDALAAQEIPQIAAALKAFGNDKTPFPDSNLRILLDSWRDRLSQLSGPAAEVWKRIERTRISAQALDRWMTDNATGLDAKAPETIKAWRARLADSGLVSGTGGYADAFSQVVMGRSEGCMAVSSSDPLTAKAVVIPCVRKPEQLWIQDMRGALRSAALPDYCIQIVDDWNAGLAKCNRDSAAQIFTVKDGKIVPITRPWIGLKKGVGPDDGSLFDQLGAYNTSWGVPQWHGLKQDPNMLLALLSDENARRLLQLDPVK
ncbi:hypothetical protein GN109_12395 [Collimonas pratensis]|uniref:M66 family metalloprotease n=1 Tax=Collimonas pratensis TaxID=279113 RepID=UPI00143D89A8|nr:M66 family metalloprotease [Collimonas pratensis]NKI70222.1 hypothetical protein [Collimonas pratensis]